MRCHHEGVGRERDAPRAGQRGYAGVVARVKLGRLECVEEDLIDEALHHLPAGSVSELYGGVRNHDAFFRWPGCLVVLEMSVAERGLPVVRQWFANTRC